MSEYLKQLQRLDKRNKEIVKMRKSGKTQQVIADAHKISRARVQAICKKAGV